MQIAWETMDDNRTEQLSRLVILYEKEMLKLCYVYLRDMTLAQDALQESFLKAYRRMDTFRGQCSERTWLTTIVINTCKDLRRSAWFRNRRTSVSPDSLPLSVPPPDDLHLDLMNAILALPVKNREVILLKYQQGLNNQEIAKLLHLSPMAVSKRMHQAYDRLKNLMEEGNEHE